MKFLLGLLFLSTSLLCGSSAEATSPLTVDPNRAGQSKDGDDDEKKISDLTFDDIAFEMEKGDRFEREMLTEKIVGYNNQKIRLRGFIRPSFRQSGLKKFVFVRDNKECCFGPGAMIFDCVLVELAEGEEADYTVRPVTIEGRFYLKEFKGPDKKVWAIYRMKDSVVK